MIVTCKRPEPFILKDAFDCIDTCIGYSLVFYIFYRKYNLFITCIEYRLLALFIFVRLRLNIDEGVSAEAPDSISLLRPGVPVIHGHQLRDDVDGDREHDGAVVLRRNTIQGLEISSEK